MAPVPDGYLLMVNIIFASPDNYNRSLCNRSRKYSAFTNEGRMGGWGGGGGGGNPIISMSHEQSCLILFNFHSEYIVLMSNYQVFYKSKKICIYLGY